MFDFKTWLNIVIIFLMWSLLLFQPSWSQTGTVDFNPKIDSLIIQVSRQNLETYVQTLAEANGHQTRVSFTEGNRWAASYVKETFENFDGLSSVTFDTFFVNTAIAPYNTEPLVNVVATLAGSEDPSQVYIVAGHLDCSASRDNTINWESDWSTVKAPGADDNATGLAAILEIARILSDPNNEFISKYTIMFVGFGAEEFHPAHSGRHHLGSRDFAQRVFMQGLNVLGVYIVDMIGYNSTGNDYFNIVSNNASQGLGETMLEVNSVYQIGLNSNSPPFPEATYSDHEAFWLFRYQAILLIENAPPWENNSPWYTANPYYHTQNDTYATINLDQVEKVTKLTVGTLASLTGVVTSVKNRQQEKSVPPDFSLFQNYPNPFNPTTTIAFDISEDGLVKLTVYDMLGREVKTLMDRRMKAGHHKVQFYATGLSSGVYYYRLKIDGKLLTRYMTFMK